MCRMPSMCWYSTPYIAEWLSLTSAPAAHHPAAKAWFDGLPAGPISYFCRLTQQGFLRPASNQSVFGKDALTLPDAWQKYDLFLSDPRVGFAEEPPQVEAHWRTFTQSRSFSPHVWND